MDFALQNTLRSAIELRILEVGADEALEEIRATIQSLSKGTSQSPRRVRVETATAPGKNNQTRASDSPSDNNNPPMPVAKRATAADEADPTGCWVTNVGGPRERWSDLLDEDE